MKLSMLLSIFKPPKFPKVTVADRDKMAANAVSITATGSVLLRQGRFTTKKDIAKMRQELLANP